MRKSAKRSGFVVPFAGNARREEDRLVPIGKEITVPSARNYKVLKNAESSTAEEILRLITNDSDDEQAQATSSSLEPANSLPSLPVAEVTDPSPKRKFLGALEKEEDQCNTETGDLSSDEITRLNTSKKREAVLPSKTRYYNVLWCKRSAKKHKKWEGDGVLVVKGRSAVLKDLAGKEIASGIGYKIKEVAELEEGSKFFISGKECEIQQQVEEGDF